jgi:predicted kinase
MGPWSKRSQSNASLQIGLWISLWTVWTSQRTCELRNEVRNICGQSFVKSTVTCLPKTLQRNSQNQSFREQCWTSALPSSVAILPLLIKIRPVNQSGSPANRNFASLRRLKNTKKHRMLAGRISLWSALKLPPEIRLKLCWLITL